MHACFCKAIKFIKTRNFRMYELTNEKTFITNIDRWEKRKYANYCKTSKLQKKHYV